MKKNKGFFITGTDTDVGKTWVSIQLIKSLVYQGFDIHPRKPIESGWINEEETDSLKLATAAKKAHQLNQVCAFRFKAALSPPRAASIEGSTVTIDQLVSAVNVRDLLQKTDTQTYLMIEGAGGFYSPIAEDGLNADLAHSLDLPIILVVNDKLGCINHTLLILDAIKHRNLTCAAIILNRIKNKQNQSEMLMDNMDDLKQLTSTPIFHAQSDHAFEEISQYLIAHN